MYIEVLLIVVKTNVVGRNYYYHYCFRDFSTRNRCRCNCSEHQDVKNGYLYKVESTLLPAQWDPATSRGGGGGGGGGADRQLSERQLVSWCFDPSHRKGLYEV